MKARIVLVIALVVTLGVLLLAPGVGLLGAGDTSSTPTLGKAKPTKPPSPSPTTSPTPSPSPTTSPPPPSGFATQQVWSTGDDWETAIAVDPSSNYVYQAVTRYGGAKACSNKGATACPTPNLVIRASADGGVTWGADRFLCACSGTKTQADPEIEVATDGTIYASWMNDYTPGVMFSKSSNRGVTWTTPIAVGGSLQWTDKPILAISPSGQDVYIAFNKTDSYVVSSHNYGASFSAPVKTNNDSLYWFAEGGVVAPNGNVYFSESGEVATVSAAGDVQLAVLRSTNGGASWTHTIIDTSKQGPACTMNGCSTDFLFSQASIGVDAAGKLLVAYTLNTTAGTSKGLYVKTSTDGVTWSARSQINAQGDSGFPIVTTGPTAGDFRVLWMDDRGASQTWYNLYYKRTTNGGSTWSSEIDLSNASTGATYKSAAGFRFPYGDYYEADTNAAGKNFVAWSEGKDYVGPGGSWFTSGS